MRRPVRLFATPGGWRWGGWLLALVLVTAVLVSTRAAVDTAHVVLAYLLLVLGASARGGRTLGLAVALLAFACFNYFFVPPYHTFRVNAPLDWLVLGAFLATGAVAAQLLSRAQSQATEAERRASDVDALASVGAEALNAPRAEDALTAVADMIRRAMAVERCEVYLRVRAVDGAVGAETSLAAASGAPVARVADQPRERPAGVPDETRLVAWVAEHGRPVAVRMDGTLRFGDALAAPDAQAAEQVVPFEPTDARALLLPLRVREETVGVLTIGSARPLSLDANRRRLLGALSFYAALGAERVRLSAAAAHADALREADRLKDALLMSVSHDLRTPLTTIKALAHAIRASGDDRAATIEEEADRLNRFVADLLDLSRLAGGALVLRPELNAAEDLLGVALQRIAGASEGRMIDVVLDRREPLLVGRFDFTQALRALVNLLENALKYAPPASTIELGAHRAGAQGEFLEFVVADRGPGVSAAERERIFQPFYRPAGSVPDAGSAGLGLSIAQRLADAQGGSVHHEPREGGGSRFVLRFPSADITELTESL